MSRRWRTVAWSLLAVVGGSVGGRLAPVSAQSNRPPDDRVQSLRDQVEEASAEESRLLGLIDESRDRRGGLDAKVAELDGRIAGVQSRLNVAESAYQALAARLRGAEDRLAGARSQLDAAKRELARQAIAAYTGQADAFRYAEMVLSAGSFNEAADRRSYLRIVVGTQGDAVSDREHLRNEVGELVEELTRARAKAKAERDVIDVERGRLQAARDAQDAVRQQVINEIAQHNRLLKEVLDRKEEFQRETDALEQQSAAIGESLRQGEGQGQGQGQGQGPAGPPATGPLSPPIPGAPIVSGFGPRLHPIYGVVRMHTGVDLDAPMGAPIRAAADGVVKSAGWMGGYGNATVIQHAGSLATLYGHQSAILVSVGQHVSRGQIIGRVGCSGACTGPHLHYEVRVDGTPVNPVPYL